MTLLRGVGLTMVILAPMALSACGIPDLVAHGIKKMGEDGSEPSTPTTYHQQSEPEPIQTIQAVPRDTVAVETLK